jgi:protoporphyrinogen oxidase
LRIGIVGAGITGLYLGWKLSQQGHRVTLYEATEMVGGLAAGFEFRGLPGCYLDKFYHHVFKNDNEIIELIETLGFGSDLRWYQSKSGFFMDGMWDFGTPLDLMKFSPLGSLRQRMMMGFNLLRLKRVSSHEKLNDVTCKTFFRERFNEEGYEKLWAPLLRQKFGMYADEVPASFLWGRVHARAGSRQEGKECLGYLLGGFQRIADDLSSQISVNGGSVLTGCPVLEITPGKEPTVLSQGGLQVFDRVIWTGAFNDKTKGVFKETDLEATAKYMAATCLILILKKPMGEFYWINSVDPEITFGILVEHTNLVPNSHYGNKHIVYIANYHHQGELLERLSKDELLDHHWKSISKMFPAFSVDVIEEMHRFHDPYSCPVYDMDFVRRILSYRGMVENVDFCCMLQVFPDDRNLNNSIRNAVKYLKG